MLRGLAMTVTLGSGALSWEFDPPQLQGGIVTVVNSQGSGCTEQRDAGKAPGNQ